MLIRIPDVLNPEQVQQCRRALDGAEWSSGKITAGHQSSKVKFNLQLAEDHPVARELGDMIVHTLGRNHLFRAAALPAKVFPPLFNCYHEGGNFGLHIDNAIRDVKGTPHRVRTDISATLFLSDPSEYDGGELLVEDTYGAHSVKLPAGSAVLYPASSLHKVNAVTRGSRIASFFWVQSLVRDDGERTLLFDMDLAIQRLDRDTPDHPSVVQLTGTYHNLLRRWADL